MKKTIQLTDKKDDGKLARVIDEGDGFTISCLTSFFCVIEQSAIDACKILNTAADAWKSRAVEEAVKKARASLLDHFCTEHGHQVCPKCASAMWRADAGMPADAISPCPSGCDGSTHPGEWHARFEKGTK